MNEKIKELQVLCEFYHLDLNVKYYRNKEVCFVFLNENEDEVFNVVVWYPPKEIKRIFYIEINSQFEEWRGGHFTKEDMLLLLSIDDLSDKELGIENDTTIDEELKEEK